MKKAEGRLDGLRWRLTATRRVWSPGADSGDTFLPPDRHGTEPMGRLDGPGPGSRIDRDGVIDLSGWAMFPGVPTARVELFLAGKPLGRARLGLPRPDIGDAWDSPHAMISGFELRSDLSDWDGPDGATVLEAVAVGLDGERHELEPVAVAVEGAGTEVESDSPAPPPAYTPRPAAEKRPHVLVCTHQLGLGGAQLYLLDLLREMVAQGSASFTMVSSQDGPVRKDVEALGIPVHITSLAPYDNLSSHVGRIEELVAWAADREFDVALVNTATAFVFAGAEAAELLGIPVVWAIHESFHPAVLWADLDPEVESRVTAALAGSATLLFEAEATQRLFEPIAGKAECLTIPYGLDLRPIDEARARFEREAARRDAGIPADAELIVCIGTIEARKAQILLAQAFDLVAGSHPNAHIAFVGGREDLDSLMLERYLAASPISERAEVIPITPAVDLWYGMADLLVCASDVESLPRTVLEAMAWETPVLATSVFGLPELIVDGESGWLCEARDLQALADALDRVLNSTPDERRRVARAARALVEDRHSLERYGRRVTELLVSAVETGTTTGRKGSLHA